MNIEQWKSRYAHLLDGVPVNHVYRDEASPKDYEKLKGQIDAHDLDPTKKGFWSRPQIRREGSPRKVDRTIPGWMLNMKAVHSLLLTKFSILREHRYYRPLNNEPGVPHRDTDQMTPMLCPCSKCRRAMEGALEWDFIIRLVRMNRPAQEIADEWNNAFTSDPYPAAFVYDSDGEILEELPEDPEEIRKMLRKQKPKPRKKLTAAYVRRTIQRIREITKSGGND